jgi:uncharacterized membrane protein YkoI
MKRSPRPLAWLAASVLVTLLGSPTGLTAEAPASARPAARLSIEQAIKMTEQRLKARVVRAESQQSDGRTVYVLRLLNESGRVWTVRVDANTGAQL